MEMVIVIDEWDPFMLENVVLKWTAQNIYANNDGVVSDQNRCKQVMIISISPCYSIKVYS